MKAEEIRKVTLARSDKSNLLMGAIPGNSDRDEFLCAMVQEIAAQLAEENEIGRGVTSLRSDESKALIGKLQSERDYWRQQAELSKNEASSTRDLIALVGKFQSVAAEQVQAIKDSTAVNAKTLAILERNSKAATES